MATNDNIKFQVSKRLDKIFIPTFIGTAIIYFALFFVMINIDTSGPDPEEVLKKNIRKAALIVKAQKKEEKKEVEKEEVTTSSNNDKKVEEETVEEVVKEVSKETKKVAKKSASQKRKERASRKAKRKKARDVRREKAASRSATRLAKIQAKSRGAGGASATAYESFKGSKGGSGDLAKTLSSSGGVSSKGKGGVGRSGGGGIGVGTGGIEDLLGSGDFGDVTSVEGIDDFKVTPLVLKKGSKKSSRNIADIQTVISKKAKNLQKCIKRARNKFKTLSGQILYQFTIKKNGKVTRVKIAKSSWNNKKYGRQVEACVKKAIKSWKFPAVSKGNVTIEQVMIF